MATLFNIYLFLCLIYLMFLAYENIVKKIKERKEGKNTYGIYAMNKNIHLRINEISFKKALGIITDNYVENKTVLIVTEDSAEPIKLNVEEKFDGLFSERYESFKKYVGSQLQKGSEISIVSKENPKKDFYINLYKL